MIKRFIIVCALSVIAANLICAQALFRVIVKPFTRGITPAKFIVQEAATSKVIWEQTVTRTVAQRYKNTLSTRGSDLFQSYSDLEEHFDVIKRRKKDFDSYHVERSPVAVEQSRELEKAGRDAQIALANRKTSFKWNKGTEKYAFPKHLDNVKPILKTKLKNITVAALIPFNERDFVKVFTNKPTRSQFVSIQQSYFGAALTEDKKLLRIHSLAGLLNSIKKCNDNLIIIGHKG